MRRHVKKIVVYYDDGTYEEVIQSSGWPALNPTPFTITYPIHPNRCMVCGDLMGHGNGPCPNMTVTCGSTKGDLK